MNILKQTKQYQVHLQTHVDNYLDLHKGDCVLYGLIFSSTVRCKIELISEFNNEVILTAFNSTGQQTIELTLPTSLLIQSGLRMRIRNIDHQAADAYISAFIDDPYQAYSQHFTQSLEETITR